MCTPHITVISHHITYMLRTSHLYLNISHLYHITFITHYIRATPCNVNHLHDMRTTSMPHHTTVTTPISRHITSHSCKSISGLHHQAHHTNIAPYNTHITAYYTHITTHDFNFTKHPYNTPSDRTHHAHHTHITEYYTHIVSHLFHITSHSYHATSRLHHATAHFKAIL